MAASEIVVPRNARDSSGINQVEGLNAEESFKQHVEDMGCSWRTSSTHENRRLHIDCWVDNWSVDVKAAKRISRRDHRGQLNKVQDALHWVEHRTIVGTPGWAHSQHLDYVAFQMLDGTFLCVERRRLSNLLTERVEAKRGIQPGNQYMAQDGVLWTRRGRRDAMTLFTTAQLKALEGTQIW
tara:strand:- start:506 stop:1051 length:546 start_codon:yes stop_codon:yes gene_type:complete